MALTKGTEEILKKYGQELDSRGLSNSNTSLSSRDFSNEFIQFKRDMMPNFSRYEEWCNGLGNSLKLKLSTKESIDIQKNIEAAHLNTEPKNVVGLAFLLSIFVFFAGFLTTTAIYFFSGEFSFLLLFLSLLTAGFLFYYFYSMPSRLANQWRLKAGSQMVPCILYTVIYMKHTSNLERAIKFASENLDPPLSIDLKKVFWDVEVGRYSTIKESLDSYLESWRGTNSEFIESFNLIESSLYEPSEQRRVQVLERALQVMLDGVYDKMMKFSHDIKNPLANLYMLGIVLPTLALALLPLVSALMNGLITWYHVLVLFNILIPFAVFYMANNVMEQRPGGFGEISLLEMNPLYSQYKSKKPYIISGLIALPLLILGIFPLLMGINGFPKLIGLNSDYTFGELGIPFLQNLKIFDNSSGPGPMGPIALLMSLLIPLSVILFFSIAYRIKTKEIIKSREFSKQLEKEFNNSLFLLGNRLGDGTPAELAFGKLIENSRGQVTEAFFRTINSNIQSMGMSLEKAIFDKKRGAILNYPSSLIATSMRILIESVKKGLRVAAQSLLSIADYVRNIDKINDRLRDLLADVTSDMKNNMKFIASLLAGLVVGLAAVITLILSSLDTLLNSGLSTEQLAGYANVKQFMNVFNASTMIPPYFLQICVGIYIIEIIFILTKTLVTVDSGPDELKSTYETGKNLLSGGLLYFIVALVALIALSAIAAVALPNLV